MFELELANGRFAKQLLVEKWVSMEALELSVVKLLVARQVLSVANPPVVK